MSIVVASVTVDFTANYAGDHRVCWRIQGSGDPYDCSTLVNCVGGATVCQAIFNPSVNTTSCDGTVTFEGYVQANCEDIASVNGRLPFTVDFTPGVICQRHEVTCENVTIGSLELTAGGSGYNPLIPPLVVIAGGGGAGATATTTAVDGVPNSIIVALGGTSGYIDGVYTDHASIGGTGTGLLLNFTVAGGVVTVVLTSNYDNANGYTPGDVAQPDPAGPSGFTPGVAQDWDIGSVTDGVVDSITLTAPGSGYTSVPSVIIDAGGTQAFATAVLSSCLTIGNLGADCVGADPVLVKDLELGEMFAVCIAGSVIGLTSEYSEVASGCCIPVDTIADPCFDYHIENNSGISQNIVYTACDGDASSVSVADGTTLSICAVLDGVIGLSVSGLVITQQAACT